MRVHLVKMEKEVHLEVPVDRDPLERMVKQELKVLQDLPVRVVTEGNLEQ